MLLIYSVKTVVIVVTTALPCCPTQAIVPDTFWSLHYTLWFIQFDSKRYKLIVQLFTKSTDDLKLWKGELVPGTPDGTCPYPCKTIVLLSVSACSCVSIFHQRHHFICVWILKTVNKCWVKYLQVFVCLSSCLDLLNVLLYLAVVTLLDRDQNDITLM